MGRNNDQVGFRVVRGRVRHRRPINKFTVLVEFENNKTVVELTAMGWAIEPGDTVGFAGETDKSTGKFIAYAYRNDTKGVRGKTPTYTILGIVVALTAIFFCWAIFPLFTFLPAGFKLINMARKTRRANVLLNSTARS